MQYGKPYTYFLKKPGGATNLLYGSLCLFSTAFVPILGQLVVLGYQAEAVDDLERDPDLEQYPDFDWNRFVQYLVRGVWPMLMQFLVGLAVLAAMMLAVAAGVAAWYASNEPWVGIAVGLVLVLPLSLLSTMLAWPLTLHAQLTRGFYFGPAMRFLSGFLRRVGGQLFVALLIHMLISTPLVLLGFLLCYVGVFPVMMVLVMAQDHYMLQLYRLYLDEGGEPIGGPSDVLELDEA